MVKVSLITTVYNEIDNIESFLQSVVKQSVKPNEFIIVDAGSSDGTFELISDYSKKYKWIRLFVNDGCSRGVGRNIAIEKAKNDIIAVTDAGCVLDKFWFERITKPFSNKNIDVVAGASKPLVVNTFEYFQGLVIHRNPGKLSRLSSRSIAFRKKVWYVVGGYPKFEYCGEDTLFNIEIHDAGFNIKILNNAIVYWKLKSNFISFFKQYYNYGKGDGFSGNILNMRRNLVMIFGFYLYIVAFIISLFSNLFLSGILVLLILIYLFVQGIVKSPNSVKGLFYVPVFYFLMRTGYILGVTVGRFI